LRVCAGTWGWDGLSSRHAAVVRYLKEICKRAGLVVQEMGEGGLEGSNLRPGDLVVKNWEPG
jgi:hypothetical protein